MQNVNTYFVVIRVDANAKVAVRVNKPHYLRASDFKRYPTRRRLGRNQEGRPYAI